MCASHHLDGHYAQVTLESLNPAIVGLIVLFVIILNVMLRLDKGDRINTWKDKCAGKATSSLEARVVEYVEGYSFITLKNPLYQRKFYGRADRWLIHPWKKKMAVTVT